MMGSNKAVSTNGMLAWADSSGVKNYEEQLNQSRYSMKFRNKRTLDACQSVTIY